MHHRTALLLTLILGVVLGFVLSEVGGLGLLPGASAEDEGGGSRQAAKDPKGTVANPFAYYPGTEALQDDEVRIVACGTGMPAARRGQAAACFLVELGNGDKFLFDVGTGSMRNVMS